jgi:hypothetical protein
VIRFGNNNEMFWFSSTRMKRVGHVDRDPQVLVAVTDKFGDLNLTYAGVIGKSAWQETGDR